MADPVSIQARPWRIQLFGSVIVATPSGERVPMAGKQDLTLSNAGLSNGTLTILGNTTLTGNNSFTNTIMNANGSFTQTGGNLLLNGGSLNGTANFNNGATLDLENNPTLPTSVVFGNSGGNGTPGQLQLEGQSSGAAAYTIGSGTTLSGNLGSIGTMVNFQNGQSQLTNQGTILLNTNGTNTSLGSGGNLTSFINQGTFQTGNGNGVTVNAAFTNSGAVTIGNGTTATLNTGLTQLAGTTTVDGAVTLAGGQSVLVQGGLLAGLGAIQGNVTNTGGTLRPGDILGTLHISGNYTQTAPGTMEIDLGGTQQGVTYDLLSVTGTASMGGDLDVKLLNGFTPSVNETFDFLTYGSRSGSFDQVLPLDPGFTYSVAYNDTTGIGTLTVTGSAGVPETSTFGSAALMLFTGGLLWRRRRVQAQSA